MTRTEGSEPVYCSEEIRVLNAPALLAEGWEQRTVSDPARVSEMEELYTSLGFETMTAILDPESSGSACTTCAETACTTYVALFTRKTVGVEVTRR